MSQFSFLNSTDLYGAPKTTHHQKQEAPPAFLQRKEAPVDSRRDDDDEPSVAQHHHHHRQPTPPPLDTQTTRFIEALRLKLLVTEQRLAALESKLIETKLGNGAGGCWVWMAILVLALAMFFLVKRPQLRGGGVPYIIKAIQQQGPMAATVANPVVFTATAAAGPPGGGPPISFL